MPRFAAIEASPLNSAPSGPIGAGDPTPAEQAIHVLATWGLPLAGALLGMLAAWLYFRWRRRRRIDQRLRA